ncbi:MAG: hypothetical protein IH859_10405 [Chloroflexi bacterium]|nr:hypothetical protein [Chloroflexota bacterium]
MADQTQDSFLREIEEELRQERYAKLWKKYGNYLIAAALAFVLLSAIVPTVIGSTSLDGPLLRSKPTAG